MKLTAQAVATLLGEPKVGTVIIEFHSSEILIGMDFLPRFQRGLVVSRHGVGLVPDPDDSEVTPD